MSYLPTDDKARKSLPLFQQLVRYFPKTLREMTKVSVVNNVRYNPDREPADINWNRGKSPDQFGSAFRHMLEHAVDGKIYDDVDPEIAKRTGIKRIYVLAQAVWRLSAACEEEIENRERAASKSEPPISEAGECGRAEPPTQEDLLCACGEWALPEEFSSVLATENGVLQRHAAYECQIFEESPLPPPERRMCACGSVVLAVAGDSYSYGGKVHAYHDCMPEGNV